MNHVINVMDATALLHRWLTQRIAEDSMRWLDEKQRAIAQKASDRTFFTAFSAVPRYTGKPPLKLSTEELDAAQAVCPGWFPNHWTVDQAGRTLLVLSLPCDPPEPYLQTLNNVFATADVGELVALYQSLPLLPHPQRHQAQAAEGIRSNMTSVFNAVAHHNPYPANYFDENAWNQMVLKAIFVGSPLHLIHGLDERTNPALAQMLMNYAHERWAAGRTVTPELWRSLGPFTTAPMRPDLQRVLTSADPVQQEAAALACAASASPEIRELLRDRPDLQTAIQMGQLTWENWSRELALVA